MIKKYVPVIMLALLVGFCPTLSAESLKEAFLKGNEAFQKGDYKSAIRYYEKVIRLNPSFAQAYYQLGLAHRESGTGQAEVAWYFKSAVEADPNFADAHNNLGKTYYGMGHFDKAEKHTLRALEINPNMMSAKFSLGWIYLLGKSDPGKAKHYFEKVLERTKIPYALFGLGMANFMSNNRPEVLDIITELRNLGENSLATQLENMIRGNQYIVPAAAGSQPLVNVQPIPEVPRESKLIKTGPQSQGVEARPSQQSKEEPVVGVSRVRLRGTLFNAADTQDADAVQEPPQGVEAPGNDDLIGTTAHPNATDPSYSPSTLESEEPTPKKTNTTSGAQKIRQMRGEVKGSGY